MDVGSQQERRHVERGIETMLPTFAKNAVKATRFASQGVNTLRGDPIVADITANVTPEQEAHTARVRAIATAALGKWQGGDRPSLQVVATPEQLPDFAKRNKLGQFDGKYKTAAGMYDGQTIYIVASRHTADRAGMKKLLSTMAHEGATTALSAS